MYAIMCVRLHFDLWLFVVLQFTSYLIWLNNLA